MPVGNSYGSDVAIALKVLNDVAKELSKYLVLSKATAGFEKFGDNALQITLRSYIADVEGLWPAANELHRQIYQ